MQVSSEYARAHASFKTRKEEQHKPLFPLGVSLSPGSTHPLVVLMCAAVPLRSARPRLQERHRSEHEELIVMLARSHITPPDAA